MAVFSCNAVRRSGCSSRRILLLDLKNGRRRPRAVRSHSGRRISRWSKARRHRFKGVCLHEGRGQSKQWKRHTPSELQNCSPTIRPMQPRFSDSLFVVDTSGSASFTELVAPNLEPAGPVTTEGNATEQRAVCEAATPPDTAWDPDLTLYPKSGHHIRWDDGGIAREDVARGDMGELGLLDQYLQARAQEKPWWQQKAEAKAEAARYYGNSCRSSLKQTDDGYLTKFGAKQVCVICLQEEHKAWTCPQRRCSVCFEEGHDVKGCKWRGQHGKWSPEAALWEVMVAASRQGPHMAAARCGRCHQPGHLMCRAPEYEEQNHDADDTCHKANRSQSWRSSGSWNGASSPSWGSATAGDTWRQSSDVWRDEQSGGRTTGRYWQESGDRVNTGVSAPSSSNTQPRSSAVMQAQANTGTSLREQLRAKLARQSGRNGAHMHTSLPPSGTQRPDGRSVTALGSSVEQSGELSMRRPLLTHDQYHSKNKKSRSASAAEAAPSVSKRLRRAASFIALSGDRTTHTGRVAAARTAAQRLR